MNFAYLAVILFVSNILNYLFVFGNDETEIEKMIVNWNIYELKCEPDVCDGARLKEIPGFDKMVIAGAIKDMRLYDSKRLKTCFKEKNIVLVGDNLLKETAHDFIYLLSGLLDNSTLYREYYSTFVSRKKGSKSQSEPRKVMNLRVKNYVNTTIQHFGLRLTATVPSQSIQITFRHNGGVKSIDDRSEGGILAMMGSNMVEEMFCLLGAAPPSQDPKAPPKAPKAGCKKPDIVIFQSAHHDLSHWEDVVRQTPQLMVWLRQAKERGTKVFWKATTEDGDKSSIIEYLNLVARFETRTQGLKYIDTPAAALYFNKFHNSTKFMSEQGGPHFGALSHFKRDKLTYTSWMTQYILNQIC